MTISESQRIGTKLLALNLRLAELRTELKRTKLRIIQLETEMDDVRLAGLFGEKIGNLRELDPQLQETRNQLDSQREAIRRVRNSQRETQLRYVLARRREEVQARPAEPDPQT